VHWLHVLKFVNVALCAEFRKLAGCIEEGPPRMFVVDIWVKKSKKRSAALASLRNWAGGLPLPSASSISNTYLNEWGVLFHFVIRIISERSMSSCWQQFTCWAVGSVSLLRIGIWRCASPTFRDAFSRWCMVSLKDLPPPA
jgi:hypothetical protein